MARQDKATVDLRRRLKDAGIKPLRYAKGLGQLFIQGSGSQYMRDNLPAAMAMYETNQDLLRDTVRFLRDPADAITRQVDRALQSESAKAIQKLVDNAVDDLKTGKFYDANRDRTEFGSNIDSLLDDFGGFDMDGFDENGDWGEIEVDPSIEADVKIAQVQEDAAAKRTDATIQAIGASTEAITKNENRNARERLKMSIKQHSQTMSVMQNILATNSGMFEMMNNNMKAMTSVVSEASSQIITELGDMKSILTEIRESLKPAQEDNSYHEPNNVFSSNGSLDVRKYLKHVGKNAVEKFNLDALSMATGGLSIAQVVELYADNPWQLISDSMFRKLIPATLQKSIETFNKGLENFFPALLTKLFDRGKRGEETGSFKDMIAGIFGFKQRSNTSINPEDYNYLGKATITNKFVKAVEEVIPMYLARIDSHISGLPLQQYNYQTGKLERVVDNLAKYQYQANDLVGRLGDTKYNIMDRANLLQFATDKDREDFQKYIYQFLQKNAEESNFIDPYISDKEFKSKYMPDTTKEDLYYNLLSGIIKSMPRDQIMAMSKNIMEARASRDRSNKSLNEELQQSGIISAFSGFIDSDLESAITSATQNKYLGLSSDEVDKVVKKHYASNLTKNPIGMLGTNNLLTEINKTLKSGIITFSYDMGQASKTLPRSGRVVDNLDPNIRELFNRATQASNDILDRERRREDDEYRDTSYQAERDKRSREEFNRGLKIENFNGLHVTNNSTSDMIQEGLMNVVMSRMTTQELEAIKKINPDFKLWAEAQHIRLTDTTNAISEKTGLNKAIDKVKEILDQPFKLVEDGLHIMDGLMFKLLYGKDFDIELASNNKHYLVSSMTDLMKAQFANVKDWFSENVGKPLKDLFMGENGLFTKGKDNVKSFLSDNVINPLKNSILGTKNAQGYYSGGMFSNQLNNMKKSGQNFGEYAIDQTKRAVKKVLYGDYVDGKGKEFVQDVDDDGNIVSSVEYGGIVGTLKKGFQSFKEFMLGPDWDRDNESKKLWKLTSDEVKTALPGAGKGALIGGAATMGMGMLTSLWLPGGPILGAMIGSAAGFIKSSDKFKKYIFGEDVTDDEGNVTHTGGLISKEVQDGFKKFAPKVAGGFAGGALLGNMGLLPFGMSPLIGGILGSMGGMIAASDQMKKLIFGEETDELDENGNKKFKEGLIPKQWQDNIKKALPGIGIGALGGTIVGGLIPGIAMLPGGPILGGLAGLAVSLNGDRISKFFFGEEEDEKDADGKPTGKKVRTGGMFGRIFNYGKDKIIDPFFGTLDKWGRNIGDWFQESVIGPFSRSIQPFKDAMADAGSNIRQSLSNIGESIKTSIDNMFAKFVGMPLGKFFDEKILSPMKGMLNKLFGGIGKFVGGIISAPFKAMEFIFTGNVASAKKDENKSKTNFLKDIFNISDEDRELRARKREEKAALRRAKKQARQDWIARFKQNMYERFISSDMEDAKRRYESENSPNGFQYIGSDGKMHYGVASGAAMNIPNDTTGANTMAAALNNETVSGQVEYSTDQSLSQSSSTNVEPSNQTTEVKSKETKKSEPSTARERMKRERAKNDTSSSNLDQPLASDELSSVDKTSASPSDNKTSNNTDRKVKVSENQSKLIGKKSNNTYLSEIAKNTKKIHDEISGQLGGSGWNLAYIKTLLEKKFGMSLSSDELPSEMEGSTRNVKKKRTIFGKLKDKVTGGIDYIKDSVSAVIDKVLAPFRKFGDVISGFVKFGKNTLKRAGAFIKGAGSFLKDALWKTWDVVSTTFVEGTKTVVHVLGDTIRGAADFIAGAAKGVGKAIGSVAEFVVGGLKDIGLAATGLARGIIQTVAVIAPDVVKGLWGAAKGIGKGIWGGIKLGGRIVATGASKLFNKITGKDGKIVDRFKNIGTFKIEGGFIDEIKNGIKMMVGEGSLAKAFPYTMLTNGVALAEPTTAIPVYIAGLSKLVKSLISSNDNNSQNVPGVNSSTTDSKNEDLVNTRKYISAYQSADRAVSRARDPKKAYDNQVTHAKSMEEIKAIETANQLNMGSTVVAANTTAQTSGEKSEGLFSGLLQMLTGGGFGSVLKSLGSMALTAFAGTKIGGALIKGLNIGKSVVGTVGKSLGSTIFNNLPFLAGTAKAVSEGDTERVGLNVAKQSTKVGQWAVKSAIGTQDILTSPTGTKVASGVGAKLLSGFRGALSKFLNSKAVSAIAKKVVGADMGKISKTIISKFDDVLLKLGSEGAQQLLKKANWVILIATAVYDVATGAMRASEYFNVEADQVTWGMRLAAGIAKGVSGLAFGLIPVPWLAQVLYKLFANKEQEAELKDKQDKLKDKAKAYNDQNGTNLSVDEFSNKIESQNNIWGKLTNSLTSDVKDENGDSKLKWWQKGLNAATNLTPINLLTKLLTGGKMTSGDVLNKYVWKVGSGSGLGKGSDTVFSQTDPKWNRIDPTMKDAGCGPTVAAMMAKHYGRGSTNPAEASQLAYSMGMRASDGGTNPEFFSQYGAMKGIQMGQGSTDVGSITSSLRQNRPVALMGQGGAFGSNMHYLMANKMKTNSTVELIDPIGGKTIHSDVGSLSKNATTAIYGSGRTFRAHKYKLGKGPAGYQSQAEGELPKNEVEPGNGRGPRKLGRGRWGRGTSYPENYNGMCYYSQVDPRWKDQVYTAIGSSSQTIGSSGCGPTSMAMAMKSLGVNIDPPTAARYSLANGFRTPNSGTSWGFFASIANKYGLTVDQTTTWSDVLNALKAKCPVVASMSKGHFTGGGHYIMLAGVEGDKILVNDPNDWKGPMAKSSQKWAQNIITSEAKQYWIISKNGSGVSGTFESSGTPTSTTTGVNTSVSSSSNTGLAKLLDNLGEKIDNPLTGLTTLSESIGSKVNKFFGISDSDSSTDDSTSSTSNGSVTLSGSSSADSGGTLTGGSVYPKYTDLTDAQKRFIAGVASAEQDSSDISAQRLEVSQMANLNDAEYGRKNTGSELMRTLKGGWYAQASLNKANAGQYSQQALQAVEEVLVQGKRTLPRHVTEHDYYGDINNINLNPSTSAGKTNRKNMKVGDRITNNMGSSYRFYKFAGKNGADGYGDPFGSKDKMLVEPYLSDKPWGSGAGMSTNPFMAPNLFGTGTESQTSLSLRDYINRFNKTISKIRSDTEKETATDRIVSSIESVAQNMKESSSSDGTLTTLVQTIGTALGQMVSLLESINANTAQQPQVVLAGSGYNTSMPTARSDNSNGRDVGSEIVDKLTSK